jgi:hypothetical protein
MSSTASPSSAEAARLRVGPPRGKTHPSRAATLLRSAASRRRASLMLANNPTICAAIRHPHSVLCCLLYIRYRTR